MPISSEALLENGKDRFGDEKGDGEEQNTGVSLRT